MERMKKLKEMPDVKYQFNCVAYIGKYQKSRKATDIKIIAGLEEPKMDS